MSRGDLVINSGSSVTNAAANAIKEIWVPSCTIQGVPASNNSCGGGSRRHGALLGIVTDAVVLKPKRRSTRRSGTLGDLLQNGAVRSGGATKIVEGSNGACAWRKNRASSTCVADASDGRGYFISSIPPHM